MDESIKDDILSQLLGEVDDYTGSKLPGDKVGGVEITIAVAPKGHSEPDQDDDEELPEDHDISMCGGGCAMHKGGDVKPSYKDFLGKVLEK